jgi:YidC/Oxa1 family membrane protein insertase
MKLTPGMQQQQGCMKWMFYIMAFVSAWFSCTVPAAVGFYWIISSLTGFAQTLIMNKWFSVDDMVGQGEARHIALLEQQEEAVKPLPMSARLVLDKKGGRQEKKRK